MADNRKLFIRMSTNCLMTKKEFYETYGIKRRRQDVYG